MRRWLIILFVLLLPLRGWVGEAMAAEAMHVAAAGQAQHAARGHAHAAVAHAHVHVQAEAEPAAHADPAAGHGSCAHCQACSSVALDTATATPGAASYSHPRPVTAHGEYPSAERVAAFKPPRA